MALGHYMCHQFGKSTKSKGSSPAESTYQTDARWRRTAMWREGLRAWVRNIKLPGSKELGRCLFSSDGKGVVKFVMLDNSPAGIMIVRFPVELEHRRAKVPLHCWHCSANCPRHPSLPCERNWVCVKRSKLSWKQLKGLFEFNWNQNHAQFVQGFCKREFYFLHCAQRFTKFGQITSNAHSLE